MKRIKRCCLISTIIINQLLAPAALANSYHIDDGTGSSGGFQLITNFMQQYIDFMQGPFAKASIAATLILGIIIWSLAPKEGLFGTVVRVVIAAIVALNLATWMGMFGG